MLQAHWEHFRRKAIEWDSTSLVPGLILQCEEDT